MEEKKITLRVSQELHLKAKRRMLDEFGEDNFQRLLHDFLIRYADGEAEGSAAKHQTSSAPSPLDPLTPDELSLALGLVAGLRQKDLIISGAAQMLKARISEKKYELKPETTGQRVEHSRRKIAG